GASPASAATVCASADGPTAQTSTVALANSALCLVNQERTSRGLKPLKPNRRLAKAANNHARDMVARGYFSHDSMNGASFVDRIRRAGYVPARVFPSLGEDLAWGSGALGTPREIVQSWMESAGHRANILNPKFREGGMGVAFGDVGAGEEGVTYALDFGSGGRR
ncbi:MAG TPA: CAP domain-containing protein, partial [Gemmatimonadales bacterium]|nr:CAP domain-containing protein [Gemmatimonadales bacterium]